MPWAEYHHRTKRSKYAEMVVGNGPGIRGRGVPVKLFYFIRSCRQFEIFGLLATF